MKGKFVTGLLISLIIALLVCIGLLGFNVYNQLFANLGEELSLNANFAKIQEAKENVSTPQVVAQELVNSEDTFQNVEYESAASTTHYFYDQLEDVSKQIYDGLEANKDNMKTGTYAIEFGNNFYDVLSGSNGQEVLGDYYQSAVEAFTYDNPDIFYIDPTKMYLNIQTITRGNDVSYNVYIANDNGVSYLAEGFTSKEDVEQCQAQIEQVKNSILSRITGDAYNKVGQIHNYLVDTINYDQSLSKANIYNLYGALVQKECVCEGYAKAFKYLLDEAGISCVIIVGVATNSQGETENHAWNYVQLNNNWYAIDTTWDDPIVQGGGEATAEHKYRYFLKGANTMNSTHRASGQFTEGGKVFSYPTISSTDF